MTTSTLAPESIDSLKTFFETPKNAFIVSHRNPDGDAIGSSLALMHFLKEKGHNASAAVPSEYPHIYSFLPDIEEIKIDDLQSDEVTSLIDGADIIFVLDLNTYERLDRMGELISATEVPKVLIDHHLYPDEESFDYLFSDVTSAATCEILFRLLKQWDKEAITRDIGVCLYTGFLTDTGTFSYATSSYLFSEVASLIELTGINHIEIQNHIDNNLPEKSLRLLGFCLSERMELMPEYGAGLIYLTRTDYEEWDIQRGDTEGLVNYILKIEGINIAAFIRDQRGQLRLSLRSLGDFSVEQIAKDHFKGGGHKNAAGGKGEKSLLYTIEKFKGVLPNYINRTS